MISDSRAKAMLIAGLIFAVIATIIRLLIEHYQR